jgi:hypothetical protein
MSRYFVTIWSDVDRLKCVKLIEAAPKGSRVEVKAMKRSLPQNDLMWSLLTDVALQLPWHGVKLRADDYKLIFLDALKREMRMMPNLEGNGFVNINQSSSDLTKGEMSDMIELIRKFGAEHGVKFSDEQRDAA